MGNLELLLAAGVRVIVSYHKIKAKPSAKGLTQDEKSQIDMEVQALITQPLIALQATLTRLIEEATDVSKNKSDTRLVLMQALLENWVNVVKSFIEQPDDPSIYEASQKKLTQFVLDVGKLALISQSSQEMIWKGDQQVSSAGLLTVHIPFPIAIDNYLPFSNICWSGALIQSEILSPLRLEGVINDQDKIQNKIGEVLSTYQRQYLLEENVRLKLEKSKATDENTKLGSELTQATAKNTKLESELTQVTDENTKLGSELTQATAKNTKLESERTQATDKIAELESELNQATDKIAELESERTQATDKNTKLGSELTQATAKNTKLESELTQATDKIAELQSELTQATDKIAELQSELTQATDKNTKFESELTQVTAKNTELESELTQATAKNTKLESELTQATDKNTKLESELTQARTKSTDLEEKLSKVHAIANKLQGEFSDQLKNRIEPFRKKALSDQDEIKKLESKVKDLCLQLITARADLIQAVSAQELADERCQVAEAEQIKLQGKIKVLESIANKNKGQQEPAAAGRSFLGRVASSSKIGPASASAAASTSAKEPSSLFRRS